MSGTSDRTSEAESETESPSHGERKHSNLGTRDTTTTTSSSSSYDQISTLPDAILVHILSFLTMEEAVATGILSKRWKYLWTYTPNLVYHQTKRVNAYRRSEDFAEFIKETLPLHTCQRIKTFFVEFQKDFVWYENCDLWVRFEIKNKAEHLGWASGHAPYSYTLRFYYTLPLKLTKNSTLRKLELALCKFAPNPLISWKSLKSLSFRRVHLGVDGGDVIEKIQSGSPQLEYLELSAFSGVTRLNITSTSLQKLVLRDYCPYFDDYSENQLDYGENPQLTVTCPNVRYLEMLGCFGGATCQLEDTDSMVEANLDFSLYKCCYRDNANANHQKCQKTVQNLLESLHNIEKLSVGTWFLQVLSTMQEDNLLCTPLISKSLTLNVTTSIEREEMYGVITILESLSNLENLTIQMRSAANKPKFCEWTKRDSYPKQLEGSLHCLQHCLKTVRAIYCTETAQEHEILKYLLENSMKLEKMIVEVSKTAQGSFQLATQLLSFPRASTRAIILFKRHEN